MKHAFSLVELSIVLVILGLLTGGILAGQSLIRAAELRAVSGEYSRYAGAAHAFRDKYMGLPGDLANATSFWGKDATYCNGETPAANSTTGTCSGNGNGLVGLHNGSAGNETREETQFWRHLANAGLVEGTYSGIAGTGNASGVVGQLAVIGGTNAPQSRMAKAVWSPIVSLDPSYNAFFATANSTNYLLFGAPQLERQPWAAALRPEEAWNIDTKMDDGKPGYGSVIGVHWNNACSAADDGGSASNDFAASYRLSDNSPRCALLFRRPY